jgi:hypothetical protein
MKCDEIQERFIDLLYNERGASPASPELQAHVESCPTCRKELEELRGVREKLQLWEDEPPLRPVSLPATERTLLFRRPGFWPPVRLAAIAAMLLIAFLVLANAQITWNRDGFSYKNSIFPWGASQSEYYTKAQVRDILKRVIDDSEVRMNEVNYLMMQELLNTVDQDRLMDLRLARNSAAQNRNKN